MYLLLEIRWFFIATLALVGVFEKMLFFEGCFVQQQTHKQKKQIAKQCSMEARWWSSPSKWANTRVINGVMVHLSMASQMGDYNPYKQSYFARTGEEGRLCSIFCAGFYDPKNSPTKLHRVCLPCLYTLEDERLEPTAITHLERKIIFQTSRELLQQDESL